jgi:hypothetical protein
VSFASLLALAAFCPQLEELNASQNRQVDDAGVTALVERCRALRVLKLHGTSVGDPGIAAVAANCAALERLEVYGCPDLTAEGILAATGDPSADPECGSAGAQWRADVVVVSAALDPRGVLATLGFVQTHNE